MVNATGGASAGTSNGSRSLEDIGHAVSVAPVPQPVAASAGRAGEWHVNLGDNDQRQMSLTDLVAAYNSGTVTPETFIWTDGMDDWRPLGEVEPVVAELHAAAAQPQAPAPAEYGAAATRGAYEPPGPAAYQAVSSEAVAYEPPAAAPAAYAAPAAAPSAPGPEARRAAVKREPRGRDLFSTQVGEDMQTSAAAASSLMGPPADDGKLTGQRNENSVLFSLAVLTKNADERAPGSSAQVPSKDDSGMIDLRALVARAESARPAAPAHADVFAPPLGIAASPLGSPLGGAGPEASGKSKLPLLIGAGAGIAVLLAMGVFIGVKLAPGAPAASPMANAAASVSAAPAASSAEAPTASAQPEPSANPSASSAAATSAPKPKAGGFGGGGGGHTPAAAKQPASTGVGTPTPAAAALPPSPAPKKSGGGDCGCNGDLMCLMKCSTH